MKAKKILAFFLFFALVVSACTPKASASTANTPATQQDSQAAAAPTSSALETAVPASPADQSEPENLTKSDQQGAVIVDVTPESLKPGNDTLIFDVSMNTHSVNLNMDLVGLSSLTTDDGRTVSATKWEGELGGHHVNGKLVFPAKLDGKPILEKTTRVTLSIKNVDATLRLFTWQL